MDLKYSRRFCSTRYDRTNGFAADRETKLFYSSSPNRKKSPNKHLQLPKDTEKIPILINKKSQSNRTPPISHNKKKMPRLRTSVFSSSPRKIKPARQRRIETKGSNIKIPPSSLVPVHNETDSVSSFGRGRCAAAKQQRVPTAVSPKPGSSTAKASALFSSIPSRLGV